MYKHDRIHNKNNILWKWNGPVLVSLPSLNQVISHVILYSWIKCTALVMNSNIDSIQNTPINRYQIHCPNVRYPSTIHIPFLIHYLRFRIYIYIKEMENPCANSLYFLLNTVQSWYLCISFVKWYFFEKGVRHNCVHIVNTFSNIG